ncbi:hypothetical protein GCM10011409_29400 [Lentibacillus populi]|uniref:Uncharacterized protein n=1 Tax=Lentibacillus populi TaxID=1827502 RepID=A0A9W5X668_9BACI|nr:hypothetical protein [Lentibacillus populi]MBT2217474.1 hypothetical protein [Virgibacillus dakarensis]GGB49908.1 hypothetical protein GCM10011409_29400 [Lentibacillus populi]
MKKFFASAILGTLLVAGFFLTFDKDSSDLAHFDREPSVLSISNTYF